MYQIQIKDRYSCLEIVSSGTWRDAPISFGEESWAYGGCGAVLNGEFYSIGGDARVMSVRDTERYNIPSRVRQQVRLII